MKKKFYYGVVLVVIFLIVLAVLFFWPKEAGDNDNKNRTVMSEAVLPIIYSYYEDIRMNPLHGYVDDMDAMVMRDTLTPLEEDRQLKLVINTFGTKVNKIIYEIRTMDMERILENTTIEGWESEREIEVTLPIENMLSEDEEYRLTIALTLEDGRKVSYYTRIVWGLDNVYDKFFYVKDFNERTFDKDAALELVRYLESGAKGDNTNYGHVNIYSSFQQVTWGNLEIEVISDIDISLKEVNGNISYFQVEYYVNSKNMYGTKEMYKVTEYYRTRYTSTRTYLLDFERTMEQYFTPVSENVQGGRINLGITDNADIAVVTAAESPSGKRVCFVKNGELWQYYAAEKTFTKVFSFIENSDIRTLWGQHNIKVANIDDEGNVIFLVYGYMNRGRNEGKVGMSVCRYTAVDKTVEELIYIPYNKPFAMLSECVGDVCYVNSSNWLFFLFEERLYSLDLASREYTVIVEGLKEDRYIVNFEGDVLVWQVGEDNVSTEIKILNLETSKENSITCRQGEVMQIIGYMEGDIVYGVTREEDIVTDALGDYICYMYKLCIADENKIQVGSYEKANVYIDEAVISDGMITLDRYEKNEDGSFEPIVVDYITSNVSDSKEPLTLDVVITELKKKEIWMNISGKDGEAKLVTDEAKSVYFEDNKVVSLAKYTGVKDRYFVHGKADYAGSFENVSDAIEHANEVMGIVTDYTGRYIWKRGNTYTSRNISGVEIQADAENTLAACVDAVFKKLGFAIVSKPMLDTGSSVEDIFKSREGYDCLYLNSVPLEQVLYCVNDGRLVIGKIGENEYVVITGYDAKNVTLLSTVKGNSYKLKLETAAKQFEENGNIFISYLEQ
ncbi:MAG: hypothetical protein E7261_02940 [Lachnospiraceae bacterium]|nr:hypothetical protein [Lachnospiraceae bacterium]